MRALILTLSLVCAQAHALGPYKCRPAQMFGGGGSSVATISIGQASSCALWDDWAACRVGLTAQQLTALCPAR